jgi:hypothetical protein
MVHYSNLIKDSVLDKDLEELRKLQQYYEARFDMMSSKGWQDLQDDVERYIQNTNDLLTTQSLEELNFRKGQLNILHWIRTLKQISEEAWEQIDNEQKDI